MPFEPFPIISSFKALDPIPKCNKQWATFTINTSLLYRDKTKEKKKRKNKRRGSSLTDLERTELKGEQTKNINSQWAPENGLQSEFIQQVTLPWWCSTVSFCFYSAQHLLPTNLETLWKKQPRCYLPNLSLTRFNYHRKDVDRSETYSH